MSLEEKKQMVQADTRVRIVKFILSLIIMFPYVFIGFQEAYTKGTIHQIVFDPNFKQNMFYMSLIGLAFNFWNEVKLIVTQILGRGSNQPIIFEQPNQQTGNQNQNPTIQQ